MPFILFDLDGTLIDSSPGILGCFEHTLRALGIASPGEEGLRPWIGPPLQRVMAHLLDTESPERIEEGVRIYRERYREWGVEQTTLYPGVDSLIEELWGRGVGLGIATSKPTEFSRMILERHGLLPRLGAVCGADWAGHLTKGELVGAALKALGAAPERTAMVGDRRFDLEGAREHGLRAFAVGYGYGDEAELRAAGASTICDSVMSLGAMLRAWLATVG